MLEKVQDEELLLAQRLVSLSSQVLSIQTDTIRKYKNRQISDATSSQELDHETHEAIKICVAIPMTSKGTKMSSVLDSPFWPNTFDSFMRSIDWRSNRYYFKFYLGFDKADELYDTGDSWSDMREEFHKRATFRMSEQLIESDEIDFILKKRLAIKLMHFDHLDGAPSQVVSQLVLAAHAEGFDYFYQVISIHIFS